MGWARAQRGFMSLVRSMAIASNSLQQEELLSAPADLPTPLSTLLGEPVFATPDPLAGLGLADPFAAQVSLTPTDLFDAGIAHDSSDFGVASTDQLTGLTLSDSPVGLASLDANLPPLLATAFASDGFLAYGESAPQSFSLREDQPFSLDLAALFPEANGIQGVTVVPLAAGDSSDWFQFGQRIPDATLAERLVIEALFHDAQGNLLSSDAVAALAPGSLVSMDVAVTDTRADGKGLIGLDLDLLWNPLALSLVDRQLVQTLPLFRSSGSLDAAAGSLTGLVAASLPSGGSGEVLGDTKRERYATLDFRVGDGAAGGLNLVLTPTKLPTRANQPLDGGQIVAVGTNTPTLPVLFGLADQPQVGVHRYQIQAFDSAGRSWQQMVSLTITNVNDAPVAVPLGLITAVEDQPFALNVSAAFLDQDIAVGDVLTYRLLGQSPSWLGLNATTGLLQGVPGNAEVGSYQLELEARDLSGATARQTLDLVVENVNDAPIWNAEPLPEIWVREGNPFEIRLPAGTITDVDQGDRLTYSLDLVQAPGLASLLVIDPVTGVITGQVPADQSEPFAFGLVATDQSGASTRVPLQLRVVDREFNRAPYRVGPDLFDRTIQEGQSVAFDLPSLFRDDDFLIGDRLNFEVDVPNWLRFNPSTGQLSGLADNNAVGDHRISFRAVDSWGATAVASFWLTVDNVNQAPERLGPSSDDRRLEVNSPFQLNLNSVFRDIDAIHGDKLSFSLKARTSSMLGMPNGLRFDPLTGEFSFTPGASDRGQLSLLFTATDRSGASSSYQLDLGIVSPDGLVEVNRSLQDLVLREGTPSLLDLSTAFQQLRSSATLAYTVEAFRLGKDGQLTSVQDPSWLSLFDRRQEDSSAEDRLTITPTLRRLDTGELIRPEDLTALPVGTTLGMDIKVSDLRQASLMPGVIGLDLDLNWSGLQLINPASANLQQAITSLFPLYRQVDSSEVTDNHLRFSAASLPNLGLGEALGDSPEESFLRLDFRLIDPTKPVRLDLTLNGEDKGGLGIGLADGTSPGTNLKLKPFSSSALMDLLLRPGAEQVGNLVLRISAKATDPEAGLDSRQQDSVSQMLRVRVENTRNNAPTVVSLIGSTKLKDNRVQVIELRDLFRDSDDYADDTPPLIYSLKVKGASLEQEQRLNQLVRIDTSTGQPRLVITAPGLMDVLDGEVQIVASDGSLQASQSFALQLTPSAQEVAIASSFIGPTITDGQAVSLGMIFGAAPLVFNDTADITDLTIRSSQPIVVHLSPAFKALAGLNDAQATSLEAQWRLLPPSSSASSPGQAVVVPISELASLLGPNQTSFDLAWIEVVPVATASGTLPIEISTSTRVFGDDGSRFGIQESARLQSTLIVPRQLIDSPSAPSSGFNPSPIGNGAGAPSPRRTVGLPEGAYGGGSLDRIGPATMAVPASTGVAAGPGAGGGSEAGPASAPRAKSLLPSNRDGDGIEDDDSRRVQRPHRPANPDDPNDLKGLLDNLFEAFNNPGSLAGLLLAMITMPGGGERGLRSLLLDSKLGQSIQVQRRNPDLDSEWNLRLRRPDGNSIPLILQLRRGQLTLLEDPNNNASIGVGGLDGDEPLRAVLEAIPYPGALLADISRKLDRLLTSSDEDVDWIGWLTSVANQCSGPGAPGIRASLAELQQAVTQALAVDQSMADAVMVTQLLHCHVQLGGELPWLKA